MGKESGMSPSTIGRIWNEHGLKPHLVTAFKLSNDKNFMQAWNADPKPFKCTAQAGTIFEKVWRTCADLPQSSPHKLRRKKGAPI